MLALLGEHLFDHLLWSIFQCHQYTNITNYISSWYRPYTYCRDLNLGPLWYQANMLPIEFPGLDLLYSLYWNYIFVFKFKQSSYLFSLKNSCPCRDLPGFEPRTSLVPSDMLPIELSWLGINHLMQLSTTSFLAYTFPSAQEEPLHLHPVQPNF